MYSSMIMAARKEPNLIPSLLAAGANVNARGVANLTPLMVAAYNGNKGTVRVLVAKGADINAIDRDGWTPIMYAEDRHPEIAEYLREKGGLTAAELNQELSLYRRALQGLKAAKGAALRDPCARG